MPIGLKLHNNFKQFNSIDAVIRLYSEWADTYDKELSDWSYVAPERNVRIFKEYVQNTKTHILDLGCGTGLVGSLLHDAHYSHIDGLDICAKMLSKAEMTEAYEHLLLRDIMEPVTLPHTQYDAIISVGTFTHKHLGPNALDNVLLMLRKRGLACITINAAAYNEEGYQAKLEQLMENGDCTIVEESQEAYIIGQDVQSRIVVLRKN